MRRAMILFVGGPLDGTTRFAIIQSDILTVALMHDVPSSLFTTDRESAEQIASEAVYNTFDYKLVPLGKDENEREFYIGRPMAEEEGAWMRLLFRNYRRYVYNTKRTVENL